MSRKNLTPKQAAFVAQIIKGKSRPQAYKAAYNTKSTYKTLKTNANVLAESPNVKAALQPYLKRHNLTIDRALKPIDEALEAVQTNSYTGEVTTDHTTRLKASDRVLKLHGLTQTTENNLIQIINNQKNEYLE